MGRVNTEKIADRERWLSAAPLTKEEIDRGLACCIAQIDANMDAFGVKFPWSATKGLEYPIIENIEWTDGFWTGLLWLAYEVTGDEKYRARAMENVSSFTNRVENKIELDHHDLGFLYTPSCVAAYKLTGDQGARRAAIMAADQLLTRWQPKGKFLQAWGPTDSAEHYRFIIDCMLNVPLLYWASEETGDPKYRDIAAMHFKTTCDNIIREDGSAFHTYYMNPETGGPDHGATRQGYSDDSAWARGQAWGMYGIPLNMRYLGDRSYLETWRAMSNYFLNRLPEDSVCYWDLIFGDGSGQSRDSSAAAAAVCGMMEMAPMLDADDADAPVYAGARAAIMRSLINDYTSDDHAPLRPILYHGVYSWHSGKGVDEGNIWGDYYFMEALVRSSKRWNPYW